MSVRGTIAVDVAFTDSTATAGGTSLNTITLRDATEYTTGKVAIVSGTVGTAVIQIDPYAFEDLYRDASGNAATFPNGLSRIAFHASRKARMVEGADECIVISDNTIAVSEMADSASSGIAIRVVGTAGTASYTLVMYGT
jgi:hypothetical protein